MKSVDVNHQKYTDLNQECLVRMCQLKWQKNRVYIEREYDFSLYSLNCEAQAFKLLQGYF